MRLAENPFCNPVCRVCHYKDLDYPEQLQRKRKWAESQLGQWRDVLQDIVPSPEGERLAYRSKSWMRAFFKDGALSFGMFRAVWIQGEWEKEFISWDTCPLHVQPIQQMIGKLRQALTEQAPSFAEHSLVGIWIGSPHLVFVSREGGPEAIRRLDWASILVPPFDQVWFHHNDQVGKKIFAHREILPIAGPPSTESAHPIRAFRQVAQSLLVEARRQAVSALLRTRPALVVDLYCGTGDLSLLLPSETAWLGIEFSKEAVKYANTLRQSGHAAFVGGVEQRLSDPKVLNQIDRPYALYLNPPRSGLTDEARERVSLLISEKAPDSVVYLSCSASSLARDLAVFESADYRVERLQPFDFFPQTEHFETLAILRKA